MQLEVLTTLEANDPDGDWCGYSLFAFMLIVCRPLPVEQWRFWPSVTTARTQAVFQYMYCDLSSTSLPAIGTTVALHSGTAEGGRQTTQLIGALVCSMRERWRKYVTYRFSIYGV